MLEFQINDVETSIFHDAPFKSMFFLQEQEQFILILKTWNESESKYDEHSIIFEKVNFFKSNNFEIENFQIEDLSTMDINKAEDGSYQVKVIFNLGHGKSIWMIELKCQKISHKTN